MSDNGDRSPRAVDHDRTTPLDRDTCVRLLQGEAVGRIGVSVDALPAVLPVNYMVLDNQVVFRTAAHSRLARAVLNQVVAFEVDHTDVETMLGWSVLVVGRADELHDPDRLDRVEARGLRPWAGGQRDHLVGIDLDRVTGRRIVPAGVAVA
jgi:nitroimidazol reductase NimA-like FMN-containing flavoprotein (pyridoxamine 5'-phosphate oxidase superfamily)